VEKSDGGFLGTLGFNAFNAMSDRGVLGYELGRRAWGKGFATEAVREVVRFGHAQAGLNRIEAVVMPGNEASVNVLRKVGFEEEGLLRAFGRWKGRYHDLRMFSILRPVVEAAP
jgi:ribosomal-protein-alanine N-acetyltransferase